jgi:hypothetical protein
MSVHNAERLRARLAPIVHLCAILLSGSGCVATQDEAHDEVMASVRDARRGTRSVRLTVRDSSLGIGDTASLTVNGERVIAPDGQSVMMVSFRTSDSSIASVSRSGVVRALRVGTATVTARMPSGTGALDVVVTAPTADPAPTPPEAPQTPPSAGGPPRDGTLPGFVAPQLPAAQVPVLAPSTPVRTIRIAAGNTTGLETALTNAQPGDEIVLADGATYAGNFRLRNRADGGTVTLRSETVPVPFQTRITPSRSSSLATIVTNSVAPALTTEPGAHGWRVIGVRFQLAAGTSDNYGIVTLGSGGESAESQFPRDIILDRVVIDGGVDGNSSRCLSLNGVRLAIVDSWLAECHARGRDAQAIAGWTGTGPFLIENNHLEGSGQAILFGGADPLISGLTPADITIRRNHLYKPLTWARGRWTVKAAFELKHAERVLFEGNVIENHWADAQVGFAILFQTISQDNRAPWSVIRDVTVRLNQVRNSASGVNLFSRFTRNLAPARRILFQDNVFDAVGRDPVTGVSGRLVQLLSDLEDVTLVQNTFFGPGASSAVLFDDAPTLRLVIAGNVFSPSAYGVIGSGAAEGAASLAIFAPGSTLVGNVFSGMLAARYPAGNSFPDPLTVADFVDATNMNYSLRPERPFSLVQGVRAGVDGSAVLRATSGVTVR